MPASISVRYRQLLRRRLLQCLAASSVSAALWLPGATAEAQVRPAIGRFDPSRATWQGGANIENRYLDRLSEPRFRERRTRLGWEVRGRTYVVMANTSRDDALLAARTIEATWDTTLGMAEYWTQRHHQQNFSVAAISVHIDKSPRRDRQEGDLRFVNDRTHIYLNVAQGQPAASEQLGKLRASTVHAFWRRSELDLELPLWVRRGLASYIATEQAVAAGDAPENAPTSFNVYDPYWQRERIGRHELAPPKPQEELSALQVRYLLEGDDARHAPAFFQALKQSSQSRAELRSYQPNDRADTNTAVDRLYGELKAGMGAWLSDPLVDQPQIDPLEGAEAVTSQQQEMAFLLKVSQRRANYTPDPVALKIVGGEETTETSSQKPISLGALFERSTAPETPLWATLDPQGNLLLSDKTDRLRELFQPRRGNYRSVQHKGKWAIETYLDRNTRLIAWLEENPDAPRRPLAKFERITSGGQRTAEQ